MYAFMLIQIILIPNISKNSFDNILNSRIKKKTLINQLVITHVFSMGVLITSDPCFWCTVNTILSGGTQMLGQCMYKYAIICWITVCTTNLCHVTPDCSIVKWTAEHWPIFRSCLQEGMNNAGDGLPGAGAVFMEIDNNLGNDTFYILQWKACWITSKGW